MTFADRFTTRLRRAQQIELDPCGGPRDHPRGDCLHCVALCSRWQEGAPLNRTARVQAFAGLVVLECDQQRHDGSVAQTTPYVSGRGVPSATGRCWQGVKLGGAL